MSCPVITLENIYGPMYEDRPLIDGREWPSVFQFMSKTGGSLNRGMLHKYCQNIHLQKVLLEDFVIDVEDPREASQMRECFDYLKEQFGHYDERQLSVILPRLPSESDVLFARHVSYFRACKPFLGKDRATLLSMIYVNKIVYGSTRELPIENLLRSFQA